MAENLNKGAFITFEGPEGCGKSTHAKRIYEDLKADGYEAILTYEPGDTLLGKRIREILLEKEDIHFNGVSELFLFEVDRAQHISEKVQPALDSKKIVICDRFNTATFAYQGYGLEMDINMIKSVDKIATGGLAPDLTILLDIDVDTGLTRAQSGRSADKMEKRGIPFHEKVRDGYLKMAEDLSSRMKVIDSSGDIEAVYQKVKKEVYDFIKRYSRTE